MKKSMTIILAGLVVLAVVAGVVTSQTKKEQMDGVDPNSYAPVIEDGQDDEGLGGEECPTPFADYDSLEEAINAAGFDITAPEVIADYSERAFSVFSYDNMIQLMYLNGENSVTIRKAAISEEGQSDISGVYMDYANQYTVDANGITYNFSGEEKSVYLVTWTDGGYNFAFYCDGGMEEAEVTELLSQIK